MGVKISYVIPALNAGYHPVSLQLYMHRLGTLVEELWNSHVNDFRFCGIYNGSMYGIIIYVFLAQNATELIATGAAFWIPALSKTYIGICFPYKKLEFRGEN